MNNNASSRKDKMKPRGLHLLAAIFTIRVLFIIGNINSSTL